MRLKENKSINVKNFPELNEFTQFGLLEWDKSKDTVTMCPLLAETLAFSTHSTTQRLSAYQKLTHPDDLATIEIIKRKAKEKEEKYIVTESRRRCRDGTWRWFNSREKILETDKDGDATRGFGTCIDITSFKKHEAEFGQIKLLLSEIKHIKECHKNYQMASRTHDKISCLHIYSQTLLYSKILKSLEKITESTGSVFIFSFAHTFRKKDFNQQELYDHSGQNFNNLSLSPEKLDLIQKLQLNKSDIIQNEKETALLGIYFNLPFEQHGIIILERNTPFENTLLEFIEPFTNTVKHLISFEINHRELDNITSYFIKQLPTPVAVFDVNMCYKFASNEWCSLFKIDSSSELIGKSIYDVYPQQPKEWRDLHSRGLAGESLSCKAEKIIGLFEEPIWVEWGIHPWYALNKTIGGLAIYANIITERVEFEKNIQDAVNNLTLSNQALKSFAHVCSHDLKEPLRNVSNFIQLLFTRNSEQFDEESLLYMRHILKGIEHMSILIKDVLSYSEAINHAPSKDLPFNMMDLAVEIKESFDYQLSEIGAQLNINNLPVISGNNTQINQLLTNLISNAIKFRSSIPLVIEIFAVDAGVFWEFHVRDNGIGIAPEYHESIFTIFKRLHSKSKYEGSGVGLAICKKIVNDHHGKIYVQSTPKDESEGGSDFVFTLPKMGK